MRVYSGIFALLLLLFASCEGERGGGSGDEVRQPVIRLSEKNTGAFDACFYVDMIYCSSLSWKVSSGGYSTEGYRDGFDESLVGFRWELFLDGLEPRTEYCLEVVGSNAGARSAPQTLTFVTGAGPQGPGGDNGASEDLYPWEKSRTGVPSVADLTLISGGHHNSNPPAWTVSRMSSHVVFRDENDTPHWLFDAFLFIDGNDALTGRTLVLGNGLHSADQACWTRQLEFWLGPDGVAKTLDAAVASSGLGKPSRPRYVIMSIPDPIRYEYFSDKSSSTTYWGSVNGSILDFSNPEDQIKACIWFVDKAREMFAQLELKNVELLGFYVLSEELPLSPAFYESVGKRPVTVERDGEDDTFNWQYKNWEIIVPAVADYVHNCREGLYWIPYFLAPGARVWKELGFDACFMQPNHYWDTANQHPMNKTIGAIRNSAGMGMELEFEYTLVYDIMKDGRTGPDSAGNPTFTYADIPALWGRLGEYMSSFSEYGFYGERPLALYSGTDALHQLASSKEASDREKYLSIGNYIINSPLKNSR